MHTQGYHAHVHTHTHLVLRDIVGVPERHLEIPAGRATVGIKDSNLHASLRLVLRSVRRPIGCIVALLPPGHHEFPVAVVVVDEAKVVVVDRGVHEEGARELEAGEAVSTEEETGARVESLDQLRLLWIVK